MLNNESNAHLKEKYPQWSESLIGISDKLNELSNNIRMDVSTQRDLMSLASIKSILEVDNRVTNLAYSLQKGLVPYHCIPEVSPHIESEILKEAFKND